MVYPKIDPFVKGGPAIRLDGMLIDWEMNRPAEPGEDYKLSTLGVAAVRISFSWSCLSTYLTLCPAADMGIRTLRSPLQSHQEPHRWR